MRVPLALALCLLAPGAVVCAEEENPWAFSVSLYGYDVPESKDYWNPSFTADRGWLHLEARYQYEAIDSASVWFGGNFSVGTTWVFESTVMVGGVFGDLEGVAPGFRLSLTRSWFSLGSEGEYFIDTHDHEGNYFYTWTEMAGSPVDWFRAGLAFQRTRAYESDLDIQRGIFAAFTYKAFDVAGYVFNPDDDPTYVIAMRFEF